jgi:hypothetical protein
VHGRDHGQTFDDAEMVWDYLFSGVRRAADGAIVRGRPALEPAGDSFAIALADGCSLAWVSGERVALPGAVFLWSGRQYHGREGDPLVRTTSLYAPLSFISEVFGGDLEASRVGDEATVRLPDGRVLQFAQGNVGVILDGRVHAMRTEAVLRGGELWISLEWFAATLFDLHTSTHSGVLYVTDHHAVLAGNMAVLIRDLLAGPTP